MVVSYILSWLIEAAVRYCVGNLLIPGYELPWESQDFEYPSNLASPLEVSHPPSLPDFSDLCVSKDCC